MPINELRSVATFIKAAELGSLRKAADAQGLTPQAASQAVAQLERHLSVRLLHRTTRSLSLTDEGHQFLEAARPALLGLQQALQIAKRVKEEVAGPLRIAAPRSTFRPVLWRVLDEFCRRHPDVRPDVQLDDRIGSWVEERIDVGFRIGISPQDGVIARRLFPLQTIICASPAYLETHGAPQSLASLASHRCSAFRHPATGKLVPWRVQQGGEVVDHHVACSLCTNDEELELAATLDGQVIAQLTAIAAAAHIRAGRLVPLLVERVAAHASIFIYYGNRAAQPARSRAFIDLAVERLTDDVEYVLSSKELAAASKAGIAAARRAAQPRHRDSESSERAVLRGRAGGAGKK